MVSLQVWAKEKYLQQTIWSQKNNNTWTIELGWHLAERKKARPRRMWESAWWRRKAVKRLYPPPTVAVNLGRTLESPGRLEDIHMPHPQTQSWNLSGAWGLKFLQLPHDSSVQPGLRPTVLYISSKSVASRVSRSPGQNSHLHLKPSSNCVQSHFLLWPWQINDLIFHLA